LEAERYAVWILGFVGSAPDAPIYLQLALIDRWTDREPPEPAISDLSWVTDRGPIGATVDTITPSTAGAKHRLTTIATHVDGLEAGKYRVKAIEYTDRDGSRHELAVGDIVLDVREMMDPSPMQFPQHTAGQLRVEFIGLTAHNVSAGPVTINGLEFDVPRTAVESEMFLAGQVPGSQGEAPAPGPPLEPVASVTIQPDEAVDVHFRLEPADPEALRFAEIAPFLDVGTESGRVSVAVPLQVYFGSFADDADLDAYLESLPPESSTTLPSE
jgi:hypothetical protein